MSIIAFFEFLKTGFLMTCSRSWSQFVAICQRKVVIRISLLIVPIDKREDHDVLTSSSQRTSKGRRLLAVFHYGDFYSHCFL